MNKAKYLQEPEWSKLGRSCDAAEYTPKSIQFETLKITQKPFCKRKKTEIRAGSNLTFFMSSV